MFSGNPYLKKAGILLLALLPCALLPAQSDKETYKLVKTVYGKLSPKSISNNGKNMFFAQNMMYNHSVTVYDSTFNLVSTISDNVKPADFGFKEIKGTLNGAPVESAATKDGKYLWVSNYNMTGSNLNNPGCDTCCCKGYDESFIYKINTGTYKIENIVKVGSVPKYLAITPDQKKIIVSNWSSGNVSVIDLETEKEIKRIFVGPAPRGIACDSASTFAYIAVMGCNKIIRMDLCTYETETFASGTCNPRHLCMDGNYLYASLNGEQSVCRINLVDKKMKKLVVGRAPRSMVISQTSHKLYVDCYEDSKIAVIDLVTFKLESEIKTHSYPIGISLSNNAKQIWVSCYTGCIQIFSNEDSKEKQPEPVVAAAQKRENIKSVNTDFSQKGYLTALDQVTIQSQPEYRDNSNCYIILGSFSVKENALQLKSKLQRKGVKVELINTKQGYTYCACKAKSDKEESEKLITELQAKTGIKGWLYVI